MSQMSNYLEEAILKHVRGTNGVAYTRPTVVYCACHTADPTDAGTGAEVVTAGGTLYTRQAISFAAPSNPAGTMATDADLTWTAAGANWGTVTHIGIWDNVTVGAGNLLFFGMLDTPKTINTGDQFKILTGQLTITMA